MDIIKHIITTLETVKSDDNDSDPIELRFHEDGTMAIGYDTVTDGYRARAYWDDQDPNNEGWAYSIIPIVDGERQIGQEETGALFE
jgi:hypothetical protein